LNVAGSNIPKSRLVQASRRLAMSQGFHSPLFCAILGSPSAEKSSTLHAVVANLIVIMEKAVP
jgi:hypothetical protein